ncbi:MAG: cobyrinate a,c-diamide synthase [Pseudomonadota bacterium]
MSGTNANAESPAILLAAPGSGHGKTSITAGLARFHARAGRIVRVFKTGPDFLDPMILERASGLPVYQLDLWMTGEDECRALLHEAATQADIILVEGVMGLFDGDPSSADLAQLFDLPVAAVIDASAMAGTFGALAHGLFSYREGVPVAGVLANRVAGDYHADLLRESVPESCPWLGAVLRNDEVSLPSRHLGLVQAQEVDDLDARLDALADALALTRLVEPPAKVSFPAQDAVLTSPSAEQSLAGIRIGIARDPAFAFIYPANVKLLEQLGATLVWFSPLEDATLPDVDSVFLPGGYPELYPDALSGNRSMIESVRNYVESGGRVYAECGGMLYLLDSLTDKAGKHAAMAGVLPGSATLQDRLVSLGMQSARFGDNEWRGHTFHHSSLQTDLEPVARGVRTRKGGYPGEAIFHHGNVIASYIHAYFASDPALTARMFNPEREPFES